MNNVLVHLLEYVLPRKMWYRRFYLRSTHWRIVRAVKLKRVRHQCERCDPKSVNSYRFLDVHHLTYKNLWHEKMEDLQVLCRKHHQLEHGK